MVIGIDHLHIHNGKFAPYVEVCGPQGPIFEYKGGCFFLSNQGNHLALVWYGDMYSSSSTPEVHGRASAGIDVLESSSLVLHHLQLMFPLGRE